MGGKRIGIVVGNNYPDSSKELKFAVADAEKMKEILENKDICGFDEVYYYPNRESREVSIAVAKIFKNADNDLIFIYYSGHGKKDHESKLCLLFSDTDEEALVATSLSFDFMKKCINFPNRKSVIIVLDCCYSGAAEVKDGDNDVTEDFKTLSGYGTIIFTSTGSTGSPTVREDKNYGHGVFTNFLIEGLEKGTADLDGDGYISIDELYEYAYKKTRENSTQSPKMIGEIEGTILIGKNLLKVKGKKYEFENKKLLEEFGDLLPCDILGECQTILRKHYESPSLLNRSEKIILFHLESLLTDDLLPKKRDDTMHICIECMRVLKGIGEEQEGKKKVELSVLPNTGQQGTPFSVIIYGLTPGGAIEIHEIKPDNTESIVKSFLASDSGGFICTWTNTYENMVGTYKTWAVDIVTGRQSDHSYYNITAASVPV